MFWLGLFLPVVYVPGYTGASIQTQWPLLFAILPPLTLWRSGRLGYVHLLGILFLFYGALSLRWTIDFHDSIWGLLIVCTWALSFWLGYTLPSLIRMWKGLAIGLSVSSVVAISQWFGYHPVLTYMFNSSAGLLYNTNCEGAVAALILIGLISHRLWFYIPGVLPSLILSHSRGAWLVLALALVAKYLNWKIALGLLLAALLVFTFYPPSSDVLRLMIWRMAYQNLSWFGLGPGTFIHVWLEYQGATYRPEFAHNDYLQLWFEFGLGALAIYCILAWSLLGTSSAGSRLRCPDWPVLVAFSSLGLFWFPLYSPIPAFIGCVVAGHLVRDRNLFRSYGIRGGPDLIPGCAQ